MLSYWTAGRWWRVIPWCNFLSAWYWSTGEMGKHVHLGAMYACWYIYWAAFLQVYAAYVCFWTPWNEFHYIFPWIELEKISCKCMGWNYISVTAGVLMAFCWSNFNDRNKISSIYYTAQVNKTNTWILWQFVSVLVRLPRNGDWLVEKERRYRFDISTGGRVSVSYVVDNTLASFLVYFFSEVELWPIKVYLGSASLCTVCLPVAYWADSELFGHVAGVGAGGARKQGGEETLRAVFASCIWAAFSHVKGPLRITLTSVGGEQGEYSTLTFMEAKLSLLGKKAWPWVLLQELSLQDWDREIQSMDMRCRVLQGVFLCNCMGSLVLAGLHIGEIRYGFHGDVSFLFC